MEIFNYYLNSPAAFRVTKSSEKVWVLMGNPTNVFEMGLTPLDIKHKLFVSLYLLL